MDARGHGIQFRFPVDSRNLLQLQSCTLLVPGNSKGGATVTSFENLRSSESMKKAAQRVRVVLDLFFLVLTLSCLGFALYRSLH